MPELIYDQFDKSFRIENTDKDVKNEFGTLWTWMNGTWSNPIDLVLLETHMREQKDKEVVAVLAQQQIDTLEDKYPELQEARQMLTEMQSLYNTMARMCKEKEKIMDILKTDNVAGEATNSTV